MHETVQREAQLLLRLQRLARDHSRAHISRLTGRSRTSLTRYMRGATLPLEFGVALVEELGVSPSWLLTGEEPVYTADVPATSAALGNELLDTMRAIENVSRLKLGALIGKGHARALREVSDLLDRYGSLRNRLNRMSLPILTDLLTQVEQAIVAGKLDRARALERLATRLERFSDDRDQSSRLAALRARLLYLDQHIEQAATLQSHAFHARLAPDADFNALAGPALELAQSLHTNQHCERSLRVIGVAKCFADESQKTQPPYLRLLCQEVMARVDLAHFELLPPLMEHLAKHCRDDVVPHAPGARLYYNIHHGVWSPAELAGYKAPTFAAATMLLSACYVTDDAEIIQRALQRARELMSPQLLLNRYHVERAEDVLNAMHGKKVPALTIEERITGRRHEALPFSVAVNRAQVLRLAGDPRATPMILAAHEQLEKQPSGLTPLPAAVAVHLRNVLSGISPGTRNAAQRRVRERALAMCRRRIEMGFGLLRMLLD